MDITQPLRLAVGSHQPGSGKGCAMNVISWENGDIEITDLPACSDPILARMVQRINDTICDHKTHGLLCPPCSTKVLELAHRTVGTGEVEMSKPHRKRVWVRIAADQARQVLHLADDPSALAAIEAAEAWADRPTPTARRAATVASRRVLAVYQGLEVPRLARGGLEAARYAALVAGDSTVWVDDVIFIAGCAISYGQGGKLWLAHRAIDRFEELTGVRAPTPDPTATAKAVEKMLVKS